MRLCCLLAGEGLCPHGTSLSSTVSDTACCCGAVAVGGHGYPVFENCLRHGTELREGRCTSRRESGVSFTRNKAQRGSFRLRLKRKSRTNKNACFPPPCLTALQKHDLSKQQLHEQTAPKTVPPILPKGNQQTGNLLPPPLLRFAQLIEDVLQGVRGMRQSMLDMHRTRAQTSFARVIGSALRGLSAAVDDSLEATSRRSALLPASILACYRKVRGGGGWQIVAILLGVVLCYVVLCIVSTVLTQKGFNTSVLTR